MKNRIKDYFKSRKGSGIIEAPYLVLLGMFAVVFFLKASGAYVMKQNLDTYANEICRVAEISGRVGDETTKREEQLNQAMRISPTVTWSTSGDIQQEVTFTVTCTDTYELGLFGIVGSWPVTLNGHASGESEVYWK